MWEDCARNAPSKHAWVMSATSNSLPFTSMHLNVMNTLEQIVGYRKRMTTIASLMVSAMAEANVKRQHGSLRTIRLVLRESRLSTIRATERMMRSRVKTARMMSGCGRRSEGGEATSRGVSTEMESQETTVRKSR